MAKGREKKREGVGEREKEIFLGRMEMRKEHGIQEILPVVLFQAVISYF